MNAVRPRCAGVLAALTASGLAASGAPGLEAVHVPPYGSSPGVFSGRVVNAAASNLAVAVYLFSGGWWTKPNFDAPLSPVQADGAWSCDVVTGGTDAFATQYAAFLVPATSSVPLAAGWSELPASLETNALATLRVTRPFTRRIQFSGYEWSVKDSREEVAGPGVNYFSDSVSNVWVDAAGRLHLRIERRTNRWYSAEIVSVRSFGRGTCRVVVDTPADALDLNAVLGLFTWNDDGPWTHREIDVEVSRWGSAGDTNNAQFVVQPWDIAGHLVRYRVPPGVPTSSYSFVWSSNRIDFAAHAGAYAVPPATNVLVAQWTFATSGVPQAGGENFRMNLWLTSTNGTADTQAEEVVVGRFVFVPERPAQPAWTSMLWNSGAPALLATNEPQLTYEVRTSTNLVDWQTLARETASNGSVRFDMGGLGEPVRHYRLELPPQ